MARTLLVRGLLVGLVAGLVAFLVARMLGESSLSAGIGVEAARTAAAGEAPAAEVFSRTVQSTAGLATASLVYGVGLGGLYALVYAVAQGRLGRLGVRATAATVAAGGFLAVSLLPALKYPANPPGASNSSTIAQRTDLYFLALAASVLLVVGAVLLARDLTPRLGTWNAGVLALLDGLAGLTATYLVLPGVDETPAGFPADVLWQFRIASLAVSLSVWATLGLVFGALTERALRTAPHRGGRAADGSVPAGR